MAVDGVDSEDVPQLNDFRTHINGLNYGHKTHAELTEYTRLPTVQLPHYDLRDDFNLEPNVRTELQFKAKLTEYDRRAKLPNDRIKEAPLHLWAEELRPWLDENLLGEAFYTYAKKG